MTWFFEGDTPHVTTNSTNPTARTEEDTMTTEPTTTPTALYLAALGFWDAYNGRVTPEALSAMVDAQLAAIAAQGIILAVTGQIEHVIVEEIGSESGLFGRENDGPLLSMAERVAWRSSQKLAALSGTTDDQPADKVLVDRSVLTTIDEALDIMDNPYTDEEELESWADLIHARDMLDLALHPTGKTAEWLGLVDQPADRARPTEGAPDVD
jgi:hypothetical protein